MTNQIKNFIEEGEKEFRQIGSGSVRFIATRKEVLDWHKQRQISLIKMIVEDIKKTPIEEGLESSQYKAVEKFKDTISSKLKDLYK